MSSPTIASVTASNIVFNSANLSATVNPNSKDTTYHYAYGTTGAYGYTTPTLDAGAGATTVQCQQILLSALEGNTVYHYTLVATNADGTTTMADQTFTTPSAQAVAQALAQEILTYITTQNKQRRLTSLTETSFRAKIVDWNARLAAIITAES